ncbi:MAG: hypothetical protein OXI95_11890 [bacterium]|nr:hypothetical protein [bacterium]MDE0417622.1 hypothetical protein [bacterium]
MPTRPTDPIIAEIHAVRAAYAARFNYDIHAMFRDLKAMEKASGRTFVRLRPRRRAVARESARPVSGKGGAA